MIDNGTPTLDALLAMDAGRALDAEIARLLGWTDLEETSGWFEDPEYGAYEEAYSLGTTPDGRRDIRVPRYSTDADAALTLPIPSTYEYYWYIQRSGDGWLADIPFYESVDHQRAPTAALALCRAWIADRLGA